MSAARHLRRRGVNQKHTGARRRAETSRQTRSRRGKTNVMISSAHSIIEALHGKAMNIDEFCQRCAVGKTLAYAQIKNGLLRARKCGRRTVIAEIDAKGWLRRLPEVSASEAAA